VSRSGSSPSRRYGSLPDVAQYLGKTNKAVEKLVERGQIPVRRLNRRLIFDFVEIDQWLASLQGTTLAEALDRCTGAAAGGTRGR
jgi:predicted DNA-binding transcriptional regulator AlpA